VLENCLITGNTSSDYAISGINSEATRIVNCTIAGNSPSGIGRFSASWPFTVAIENSILRNSVSEIDSGTVATVSYSDVKGGFPGTGNIDADPKFVDPTTDYHLSAASPCIDAGTIETSITVDLDGAARPIGGGWDMGAYESSVGSSADKTPPTVSIMVPTDGDVVSGAVWIGAGASDTGSGVSRVEFRADGVLFDTQGAGYMYIASWDSSGAVPGTHTIDVIAFDNAGNSASASITVIIAEPLPPAPAPLPLATKRAPSASSLTYKRKAGLVKFTLSATFSDAQGSVSDSTVWLQKSANGRNWANLAKLKTNSSGKVAKSVSARKPGTTYYRWFSPASAAHRSAVTSKQKVRVR
jgi:hypothetical protein